MNGRSADNRASSARALRTIGIAPAIFASSDVPYLRAKQAELNVMLKASAQAKGVTYVDVYGPSAGHDPCSSTPWVNKVIDIPPLHPTHRGQTAVGNLIADALS